MAVQVRLLGGFGVEVDERSVDVASLTRRSRELVELLALTPGHRLLRDQGKSQPEVAYRVSAS